MANSNTVEAIVLVFAILSFCLTALGCCALVYIDWHNDAFKFAKDFFDFFRFCGLSCIKTTTGVSFVVCLFSTSFFVYKNKH